MQKCSQANKAGMNKKLSILRATRRIVPMVLRAVPFAAVVHALIALAWGISIGIIAPVSSRLYDALALLAIGEAQLRDVYIIAAVVTGILLFREFMNAVHAFSVRSVLYDKIRGPLSRVIHKKIKTLPAAAFEDKDTLDDIEKAGQGKDGALGMYLTLNDVLFLHGTFFVVMGIFLWSIQPILIITLVLIFVPVFFSQMVEAKLMSDLEAESAPIRRKNAHYEHCIIGTDTMKETRLFGGFFFFKNLFTTSLNLLAKKEWDTQKKITKINLLLNFVKAAGWVGILVLLFHSLMSGNITVGAFAAVFASIDTMFGFMENVMDNIRWGVTNNLGRINNFLNLLDYPTPAKSTAVPDFEEGIQLENVTFYYPKAENPAVSNVTLKIPHGETLALVGENGSGKTTLVKLLCGLYKPDDGSVMVGGIDSADTTNDALFAKTSAAFQVGQRYIFSLKENVCISEYKSEHDPLPAMRDADVNYDDTATFPQGIETILTRDYEGVELSGGQWQRVTTARGLYRHHEFIVLDEPTAAIDPLEETRIYKRFAELTQNKTAILVTHRLGSTKIADRIAVMDGGKIVEIGTHDTLLALNGKYAEMWAAQADSYA
ncbi:MAG: ABC transporter ATP-binding protein/permease [Defluviitaleaceae bacterium]|nr:ABC transporter ATP-binding protein/permease [Defluviitaleaceae bacterium]